MPHRGSSARQFLNPQGRNLNSKRSSDIKKMERQIRSQQKAAARANKRNRPANG